MPELTELDITKVDFVDQGANPEADVLLYKRAVGTAPEISETVLETGGIDADTAAETLAQKIATRLAKWFGNGEKAEGETNMANKAFSTEEQAEVMAKQPEGIVQQPGTQPEANVQKAQQEAGLPPSGSDGDIYKNLHPAVAAELQYLRKRAEETEQKELADIAKSYAPLGKKEDELMPLFKKLKDAGVLEPVLSMLDEANALIEKSAAFTEIGKSGRTASADEPWQCIEKHAREIMHSTPDLAYNQAIQKACEAHPELVQEYEEGRQ